MSVLIASAFCTISCNEQVRETLQACTAMVETSTLSGTKTFCTEHHVARITEFVCLFTYLDLGVSMCVTSGVSDCSWVLIRLVSYLLVQPL